jgi:aerobic C4-dicarboxylate transport protein
MSEARAITNFIGNGVATLVVARSEGQFDDARRMAADAAEASGAPPSVAEASDVRDVHGVNHAPEPASTTLAERS